MEPQLDDQGIVVGVLDPLKICLDECDASSLGQALSWLPHYWLNQEYLVHLFDDTNLPPDSIFKIMVVLVPNHVDSSEREVFL